MVAIAPLPVFDPAHLARDSSLPGATSVIAYETIRSRLDALLPHWKTKAEHQREISYLAKRNVNLHLGDEPTWYGRELAFYPHQIYQLDAAIWQVHREACREKEVEDYGLFRECAGAGA